MRNRRGFAVALLSPITDIYLLVMVAPVSFFLSISVFRYSAFNLWDVAFTGQNFARLFTDSYYRDIVIRTIRVAGMCAALSLLLGFPLAYFLARTRTAWRGVLMFLVIAPIGYTRTTAYLRARSMM